MAKRGMTKLTGSTSEQSGSLSVQDSAMPVRESGHASPPCGGRTSTILFGLSHHRALQKNNETGNCTAVPGCRVG